MNGRGQTTDQHEPVEAAASRVRLCICVDDFGQHAGINAAALELVAGGRVHALACQVGGGAWRAGARELRHVGGVDVGLHLDLTQTPLTVPAQPLSMLITRSLLRRLDGAALEAEITAQLEVFEAALGRAPDFVDGHQHVHQLPQVREALLKVLQRRGPHRPWLRSTRRRKPLPGSPWATIKPWFIEQLGARELLRQARGAGFGHNQALLGVYDFTPSVQGYARLLQAWLAAAKDGDLLMCHPGGPVEEAHDTILLSRRAEHAVLGGAALPALLTEHNITLAPLSRTLPRTPR